jgi:uncharacterized protein (TIGR02246 family)
MIARRTALALLRTTALVALVLVTGRTVGAQAAPVRKDPPARTPSTAADSAAVVAAVSRLHQALATGDSTAVLALLTDDVVVLESGGIESRAEYRHHHLPADIEFARAIKSERKVQSVTVAGDAAWVSATSTTQGEFKGRPVNSAGAELMVLRRVGGAWRIAAIHWSSRRRSS